MQRRLIFVLSAVSGLLASALSVSTRLGAYQRADRSSDRRLALRRCGVPGRSSALAPTDQASAISGSFRPRKSSASAVIPVQRDDISGRRAFEVDARTCAASASVRAVVAFGPRDGSLIRRCNSK